MRFYPHERLALLVDGPNLWGASKAMGLEIDFGKMREFFADKSALVSATYFGVLPDSEDFNPVRRLADWLDFNGWQAVTRPKAPDVDLAVCAMEVSERIDHFVLVTGDSDFVALVEALQRRACTVTVLSTLSAHGAGYSCSDDLRRAADQFLDLNDFRTALGRPARATKELVTA